MLHLYSPKDVKIVRDRLILEQGGIDPILKEKFVETVCLDHDHSTQRVRSALNRNVNAFEGKVVNAYTRCLSWLTDVPLPVILRNLADYLEQDYSQNPYHPGWIKDTQSKFNRLSEKDKARVLGEFGITDCKNSNERKESFRKIIMSRKYTYEYLKGVVVGAS